LINVGEKIVYTCNELYLRKACVDDCDLLFNWANDRVTRKNSFHSEQIKYEDHVKWFKNLLSNDNPKQYILMSENVAIGQLRLAFADDVVEISYSIDELNRGLGYGKAMISMATSYIKEQFPNIKTIVADVKPANIASINCFLKNGFKESSQRFELKMDEIKPK